jgi:probable HAF family extracellular repeat protein
MTCIYQKLAGAAACTVLGLVASQSADAASLYSLTDLGSLTGKTFSYASSINNLGQVAVNSGFNDSRAFLYSDDQLIEIEPLPGDDAIGITDINNFGQVVGNSVNNNTFSGNHALIYSDGTTQSLGLNGIPYAINDSGQVVGGTTGGGIFPELAFPYGAAFLYSGGTTTIINTNLQENYVASGMNNLGQVVGIFGSPSRAFLYDNGTITNLGTLPGDNYSSAEDINDLGQVVGVSAPSGVNDGTAFLYSSNTGMISLGKLFPTDAYSVAIGINNLGQVVGWSGTNPNFYSESGVGIRAFLYSDGIMQDLNELIAPGSDFILTQAQGINDRGQIAGAGVINGELHAVLLTPQPSQGVPEPASTLGILAFGAIGAGSLLKRKL